PALVNELSDAALPAAVYGVMMYLIVIPFVLWRRKVHQGE
ncbi:MAG: hypothetical protein ACI91J_003834, partial [Yoonia sp.]